jgi:anti-sigma regulatory factor (Ser/Thr protein kinase)
MRLHHSTVQTEARRAPDLELVLPRGERAPADARVALDEFRERRHLPTSVRSDLLLLVSEIVTNAVLHSGDRAAAPLVLTASVGEDTVRVALVDSGHGFSRTTKREAGGYGPFLLERLASSWGVDPIEDNSGTRVWFELPLIAAG